MSDEALVELDRLRREYLDHATRAMLALSHLAQMEPDAFRHVNAWWGGALARSVEHVDARADWVINRRANGEKIGSER